jgi:glutathione S-transferase
MQLIIATPSPFARKARIALIEKSIEHEVVIDNPWTPDALAPDQNPLAKIPVLIPDQGDAIYDSRVIIQYLEAKYPETPLLSSDATERITQLQIEALADGICDAIVLLTIEAHRKPGTQSPIWVERQRAKIVAGMARLAEMLGERESFGQENFNQESADLVGIHLADIAAGCALAYTLVRLPKFDWCERHPTLADFSDRMESRPSFEASYPTPQPLVEIA